jgi:octaheme c-type cytochrome (tetrathionate reductase family)
MRIKLAAVTVLVLAAATVAPTLAGSHDTRITGPFKNGPEVTRACLECHGKQGKDFMKSPHWTWSEEQTVNGKKREVGKKNIINNFCIALPGNWPRCTSCHAGYGWKDGSFDFSRAENVDCLVCHDTTGTYKKFPTAAGHPVYEGESKEFPKGKVWPPVDLVKIAKNVGKPGRANCGACHFYGGGGDHVKHGDLDSSMTNPTPDLDVHMGRGMTCEGCHKTKDHAIPGESLLISQGEGMRVRCTDCHQADLHRNPVLNTHAKRVACQTCHIPAIAKTLATMVWWDWSKAGQDIKEIPKDKFGEKTYDKMKGEFRWDRNFAPSYSWYNGQIERILPGDRIDPGKVVAFNRPQGTKDDPKALLTPFKQMRGKQPYDKGNRQMVYVALFGPQGYWTSYDWNQSITNGMKAAGLPYSGQYDFVETSMVWKVNHMVVPKEKALGCADCHGEKGRLDWQGLGYPGDPRKKP